MDKLYKIYDRSQIIERQGWSESTMNHLMEYFIESNELGEEFDNYLINTANQESESASEKNIIYLVISRESSDIRAFDNLISAEEYMLKNFDTPDIFKLLCLEVEE